MRAASVECRPWGRPDFHRGSFSLRRELGRPFPLGPPQSPPSEFLPLRNLLWRVVVLPRGRARQRPRFRYLLSQQEELSGPPPPHPLVSRTPSVYRRILPAPDFSRTWMRPFRASYPASRAPFRASLQVKALQADFYP